MKNILIPLLLAIFCCQVIKIQAQTTPATPRSYSVHAYMKVAPGKEADYLKMEKAYKKIHAASKKAGKPDDWSLNRV